MSQSDSEESPSSTNPFNQAGVTALLIGLIGVFISNESWRNGTALAAPFVSYGLIHYGKSWRMERKTKKACLALDKVISRLRATNQDLFLPALEREENEREIVRLNQLRTNTELKEYDIK